MSQLLNIHVFPDVGRLTHSQLREDLEVLITWLLSLSGLEDLESHLPWLSATSGRYLLSGLDVSSEN